MSWRPDPGEETEDAKEECGASESDADVDASDAHWVTPTVYNIIYEWQAEHHGQSWSALAANDMAVEALNQFEDKYGEVSDLSSNTIGAAIDQW